MLCQHDNCPVEVTPRATPGRPARYCPEHRGGKYSMARSRSKPKLPRSQCCRDAGTRGGRKQCDQHKQAEEERWISRGAGSECPDAPARRATHSGSHYLMAMVSDAMGSENRGWHTWEVGDDRALYYQGMTQTYRYGALQGAVIEPIGSWDWTTHDEPVEASWAAGTEFEKRAR